MYQRATVVVMAMVMAAAMEARMVEEGEETEMDMEHKCQCSPARKGGNHTSIQVKQAKGALA